MVDAYSALNTFAQYGYVAQGVVLTKSYISGGFFGLDGIHPTSQGYAYVANLFIQAINSHFGSNIPIVPISSVPGSIMFGNSSMSKLGLPNIHYSDLKTMLQLIHRKSTYLNLLCEQKHSSNAPFFTGLFFCKLLQKSSNQKLRLGRITNLLEIVQSNRKNCQNFFRILK